MTYVGIYQVSTTYLKGKEEASSKVRASKKPNACGGNTCGCKHVSGYWEC